MKVFLVGGSTYNGYLNWILDVLPLSLARSVEEADFVFFAGGEDVNPALYGEKLGYRTSFNQFRDNRELETFKEAQSLGKKLVGVCRGGQFLTVMAGAKLVQDMRHPFFHPVKTYDGQTISVSSTHHQQFLVEGTGVNYNLLAYAERLSGTHLNGNDEDYKFPKDYKEPEVVIYPDIKAFACQSHPEMLFSSKNGLDNGPERDILEKSINWCQKEILTFLK
jgi:hypothetical protein